MYAHCVPIAYLSVACPIKCIPRGVLYVQCFLLTIVLNIALPDVIQAEVTLPLFGYEYPFPCKVNQPVVIFTLDFHVQVACLETNAASAFCSFTFAKIAKTDIAAAKLISPFAFLLIKVHS